MASWTTPKTWAALTQLTASELNVYVRDNLNYLKSIADGVVFKGVQVTRAANQSIADDTEEYINWDTQNYDQGGWWASGSKVIVPTGVVYSPFTTIAVLVFGTVTFAANTTGKRYMQFHKNGTSFAGKNVAALDGGDTTTFDLTDIAIVAALDELQVQVNQTSGGNLNVTQAQISVIRFAPVA